MELDTGTSLMRRLDKAKIPCSYARIIGIVFLILNFVFVPGPVLAQQGYTDPVAQANGMRLFQQGLALERAGDVNNAIQCFHKAIGFYPGRKEFMHHLARVYQKQGNNQQAYTYYKGALNIDSNYYQCRFDYALFLLNNQNDVQGAIRELKNVITTNPKYPFPYYHLGLIMKSKGDLQAAIENFESAIRCKPDYAEAHKELGLAIYERAHAGDLFTAVEALERAVKYDPQNPMIHYHLGCIYTVRGNLDGGEAEFRKSLMCDPQLAAAHWELGKLRYFRGDTERCLSELQQALKINPYYGEGKGYPRVDPVKIKELTAQAQEHRGDLVKAIEAYGELARMRGRDVYAQHTADLDKRIKKNMRDLAKKPVAYDPEEIVALVSKGIDQYEDGNLDAAKASFQRALELNPTSFASTMNLASVLEAQGDLNGAVAANQKACQLNPHYEGALFNLAYLLEKMNLPNDAALVYEKFYAVAGKYPYDPQHIIHLQQGVIRDNKIEDAKKRRGY